MADPQYNKLRELALKAIVDLAFFGGDITKEELAEEIAREIWPEIKKLQQDLETSRERLKKLLEQERK